MTNPYNSFEPNPDGFDARMQQDPQTQSYAQYQESLNNPQAQYPQFNAFQQQPQAGAPAPYGQQHGMAQPGMMQPAMYATPPKSWIVTLLLAFFLGTLGAHNFYLGYKGRAIAQLSLSVIGWFTAKIGRASCREGVWSAVGGVGADGRSGKRGRSGVEKGERGRG